MKKLVTIILSLFICASVYAGRDKVFDFSGRGPQIFSYERVPDTGVVRLTSHIPKILGVSSSNVLAEWYAGYTSAGDLLDISGNSRDLADTASPPIVDSNILGHDGTGLKAFSYDGSTQYHSRAHESWMNMFSTSHSLVMVVKAPSSAPAGSSDILFSHGVNNADGFYMPLGIDGRLFAQWFKVGSGLSAIASSTMVDGNYHIIHVVRNGDVGKIYVDGVAGTETTGLNAGYGLDGSRTLYIARYVNAGLEYNSPIAYTRLQNTALTYSQVKKEVALFQNVLTSRSAGRYLTPTFLRETSGTTTGTAYTTRNTGSNSLVSLPANWPSSTPGSGVLIQPAATQLLTYTGAFSTNWTKSGTCTIAATSVTLPDGTTGTTNTFHEGTDAATTHSANSAYSSTTGTAYCASIYAKYNSSAGVPREWVILQVTDGTNSRNKYFNIRYGVEGTLGGALSGGSGIQAAGNGWYRIWVWATAGATSPIGSFTFFTAEADNDATFTGLNQDSVFIYGPQLETGAFPTSYIPRVDATAASRAADFLSFIPWRVNKDLQSKVNATPRLLFKGSESLNAATVTPTVGAYTFTKNGRPQNGQTESEGNFFSLNGSTDYLSLANGSGGSDFNPSGDFSVVVAYTPLDIIGNVPLLSKCALSDGNRGWWLYQLANSIVFSRSTNGLAGTVLSAQKTVGVISGKPVLVTATYSTINGLTVMVDGQTAATNPAATGTVFSTTTDVNVGFISGMAYAKANIHYAVYYPSYLISQSEHDAMYASFKQDGILPLTMSSTTAKKKLSIEFDAKCLFASSTDIGAEKTLLALSGNAGLSSWNKNILYMGIGNSGSINVVMVNNTSDATLRFMSSNVNPVVFSRWNTYKTTIDFSDLSNATTNTFTINGVSVKASTTNYTGAQEIKFHDTLIRFGQSYAGGTEGACEFRNVKFFVE